MKGSVVELPAYMNCLTQDEIDALLQTTDVRIVACGVHPDGTVMLLTTEVEVRIFDEKSFTIPSGDYLPSTDGLSVLLPNVGGRWPGSSPGFVVASKWMIDSSEPALGSASLLVADTYLGEIDISSVETVDP
jgi:hypothetical protein